LRKIKFVILTLFVFLIAAVPALAEQVKVYEEKKLARCVAFAIGLKSYVVDGKVYDMDAAPFVQDGRTFVPVRFLGYALGLTPKDVIWDDATQTATLNGIAKLQMTIGRAEVVTDGRVKAIDVAPLLKSDRTMLPARYVAEGLGYEVEWDAANEIVFCWPKDQARPDEEIAAAQAAVQKARQQQAVNLPAQPQQGQQAQQPAKHSGGWTGPRTPEGIPIDTGGMGIPGGGFDATNQPIDKHF